MRVLGFLFVLRSFILLVYCFDLKEHGEYGSDCHWELKEYKLDCPLKLDNYSSCIGNDIDLDTPRATRFLCGKTGTVFISWDIIPADQASTVKDYYVVLGTNGDFCSDPMREFEDQFIPNHKNIDYWRLHKNKSPFICISAETTNDQNRCFLNEAELFIKYGYGPGCILIYCDNLWDPCYLNLNVKIDPIVWVEPSNQKIKPFTKTITINGGGWDPFDKTQNYLLCYDGNDNELSCICSETAKGYLKVNFDKPLMPKNAGFIKISVKTLRLRQTPIVIVGELDFSAQNTFKTIAYMEIGIIVGGVLIGFGIYAVIIGRRIIVNWGEIK